MSHWMKKLAPILFCFLFLTGYSAGDQVTFGGEIPWPLSTQRVITVKNSQGLWQLGVGVNRRLFNVEMRHDSRSGYDWVRVSKLNAKTYAVQSWGEAYFFNGPTKVESGYSSYFSVGVNPGSSDKNGRYLYMYPNGDLESDPYLLRMVEVETSIGRVLGLSVIDYLGQNTDHFLGTRLLKQPLECHDPLKDGDTLECFLTVDH